jgi:hypothetical protein
MPHCRSAIGRTLRCDGHVAVFAYGAGITTSPCDLVGAPVAATGAVRLHYVARVEGGGATVFQVGARGTVTLATGGEARLTATWRQVVRPDGTLLFDLEPVTLTPR